MNKLSPGLKLAYASGTITFACKDVVFVNFILLYYRQVLGVPGSLVGLAVFISLLSDAVSDPVMGSISDRFRSRWGRRHPFMVIAPLPLALCFIGLLNPPAGLGDYGLFAWLIVMAIALRTCLTVFFIPYMALGAELTTDYNERTSVTTYRTTLGWIVAVTLTAFVFIVLLAPIEGADGQITDGRFVADNYRKLSITCFFLVLAFTSVCVIFTRKRIPYLAKPTGDEKPFGLMEVISDLRGAARNRNFRFVFAALLTSYVLLGVLPAVATHVNTYFWEFTTAQIGLVSLLTVIPNIAMFVIMGPLAKRVEKHRLLQLAFIGFGLNLVWFVGLRLLGVLPENGHPILILLFVTYTFLLTGFMMLIHIIPSSIVADVADELEFETGERREGTLLAANGLANKSVSGVGVFAGGIILDLIKFPENVVPGEVPSEVLFRLGVIVGPMLGILFIVPFVIAGRLDLTRAKHAEIQAALMERKEAEVAAVAEDA